MEDKSITKVKINKIALEVLNEVNPAKEDHAKTKKLLEDLQAAIKMRQNNN